MSEKPESFDLYDSVDEIRANEQVIVYCLHEKIGHLGIFVSAKVADREHTGLAPAVATRCRWVETRRD